MKHENEPEKPQELMDAETLNNKVKFWVILIVSQMFDETPDKITAADMLLKLDKESFN